MRASSRNLCHTFYLPCNSLIRYLNKLLENPKLKGDMAINDRDVVIRKKVFSILVRIYRVTHLDGCNLPLT